MKMALNVIPVLFATTKTPSVLLLTNTIVWIRRCKGVTFQILWLCGDGLCIHRKKGPSSVVGKGRIFNKITPSWVTDKYSLCCFLKARRLNHHKWNLRPPVAGSGECRFLSLGGWLIVMCVRLTKAMRILMSVYKTLCDKAYSTWRRHCIGCKRKCIQRCVQLTSL